MVNLINCSALDLKKRIENKKLVCFGAGSIFELFSKRYKTFNFDIELIVDNNKNLTGAFKSFNGKNIPVISFKQFVNSMPENIAILITNNSYFDEILNQLNNELTFNGVECYIFNIIDSYYNAEEFEFTKGEQIKIPKKIHYCWFGNNPIPEHLQKFMDSWIKFCSDYEIVKWDESNYDIDKNFYMKQAYEAKKWGFVSDYARIDIIYNHGGIYLDTDVEVVKSFDDLLYDEMYCGFETNSSINFGLGFGAIPKHPVLKTMMELYENLNFINDDGSLNLITCSDYQSEILNKYGFELNNKYQNINGIAVYPIEVLCPINSSKYTNYFTENTHSVHHYDTSWKSDNERKIRTENGIKLRDIFYERM